jgi:putative RecB family exonuclease
MPATIPPVEPEPARSHAELACYERCPKKYEFEHELKTLQRPNTVQPHAKALRAAGQHWERSNRTAARDEVREVFLTVYWAEIERLREEEPDLERWLSPSDIQPDADIPRRERVGLEDVNEYIDYYTQHPDERPWKLPDGELAIGHQIRVTLGGVSVEATIDMILDHPQHDVIVRNTRPGRAPSDTHLLCVYAVSANVAYRTTIRHGDFWQGKTGRPSKLRLVAGHGGEECTVDYLTRRFVVLDRAIRAGRFPARPGAQCQRCSFNQRCDEGRPFAQ